MSSVIKIGSQGKWKWTNVLKHAGWTLNEDRIRKTFTNKEAEIIMEKQGKTVDVFTTVFFLPKQKWIFYPLGLYDHNIDKLGTDEVQYKYAETVPKYYIYQSLWKDNKWTQAGKIGFCLPKTNDNGNYLFIPISYNSSKSRRDHYNAKSLQNNKFKWKSSTRGMLTKRKYYIYDVNDDHVIKDNARLMYLH